MKDTKQVNITVPLDIWQALKDIAERDSNRTKYRLSINDVARRALAMLIEQDAKEAE
jgi:hypothetical protein